MAKGATNEHLEGTEAAEILTTGNGNNQLSGLAGNDTLDSGSGNDKLDGGDGDDSMAGGDGNDNLIGGAGNDYLDGGDGNDKLAGGAGDDIYVIADGKSNSGKSGKSKANDVVSENEDGGTDSVNASISYTLVKNVENLILTGTGDIDGTGYTGANTITGNAGDNTLNGKDGNDSLTGGEGSDIFMFDTKLNATGNLDTLVDFVSGTDHIGLSVKVFTAYKKSSSDDLSADFVLGTAALDETDHFLYDSATGNLFYDADGSGSGAAVQFATLTGAPTLVASDLHFH